MSNQLPLRDIHLPAEVPWFPPAPGWWLLAIVALLSLGLAWRKLGQLRQRSLLKKRAREEMVAMLTSFRQHRDASRLLREASQLLKRIGMSYFGRRQLAGLHGRTLVLRLNELVSQPVFSGASIEWLALGPYQRHPALNDAELNILVEQLRRWINALPARAESSRD